MYHISTKPIRQDDRNYLSDAIVENAKHKKDIGKCFQHIIIYYCDNNVYVVKSFILAYLSCLGHKVSF